MPGSPGKLVRLGVLWPPDRELEFEMAWLICKKAPGSQATLGRGARDCQKTDAWAWYHPRGPATTRSAVMHGRFDGKGEEVTAVQTRVCQQTSRGNGGRDNQNGFSYTELFLPRVAGSEGYERAL
ncbi:unnamed protein product [Diplocarpon coronariae]